MDEKRELRADGNERVGNGMMAHSSSKKKFSLGDITILFTLTLYLIWEIFCAKILDAYISQAFWTSSSNWEF